MAAVHGAAQTDLDTVIQFGQSHGLTVTETSVARRLVALSGTVRQMNEAFAVDLGQYESPGGRYRGREGPVHLPGDVADVVVGVFGLDNRAMARRANNGGPAGASTLTPPQVAKLYNFPTGSAAGQTIAILEFGGGYDLTDIGAFFSGLPQTTPHIQAISVDGVTNSPIGNPGSADGEVVLDIDVAGSVGVGADIAVYFAPITDQGWADAVTKAVLEPTGLPAGWAAPSVLTCSWGWTELEADAPTGDTGSPWPFEWTQQAINLVSGTYQQAAMMGVTVFNCTFDDGSNEYQDDGNAHVAYPCSDIWVTACGGTLITNVSGSSFTENTWNDDAYQQGAATGGGISDAIGLPAWQQGIVPPSVNPGGRVGRGLPDIAGNASYFSGYLLQIDGQSGIQANGTSSVAPLYAGLIALINAKLGQPVGYLNPTLYALAQDPGYAGVIRDINDGISNAVHWTNLNGTTGGPSLGYTSGPGWDACTGLGVLDGSALLGALQDLYAKKVTLGTDRDHFGQDEIDGIRAQTGAAVVGGAFFVQIDGFTPKELSIVDATSLSAAPPITFSPGTGISASCSSLQSDDPAFGPEVQRFRFGYDVNFGPDDSAFTSFAGFSEPVNLTTTLQGLPAGAQITLIKQPDPYINQGAQTWWLSSDIRLIQVATGDHAFGVPMGTDPFVFLSAVTAALETGQGTAGGQPFDTDTQEDSEILSVAPTTTRSGHTVNVYNFALARVHYQGFMSQAEDVRVFFRLFAANSTATDFQPGSTYARYAAYSPDYPVPTADFFQNVLPTPGVSAGEYVSVPCYAEARQDATQAGPADSLPGLETPDTFNVRTLLPTGNGPVHDTFYGCWLDINQTTPVLPTVPPAGNDDGPWPSGSLPPGVSVESLRQAFIVNEHQCLVAEIAFDPVPIGNGTQPWNSDKFAQRNISWSYVANPGVPNSRIALEPFEVRPTPDTVTAAEPPDELMIDWTNVPAGQAAEIYLPAVDADAVLAKAAELYRTHRLTRVDAHTIGCLTGGVSYIPLPQGAGDGANFAGLLSVNLPYGITKGQTFTVIVRQLTNASAPLAPPPPPPPQTQVEAVAPAAVALSRWRQVRGTFQVNIPVTTREALLPREEQRLSIFRWMAETMPTQRRWYPVFQRYLQGIADRVQGLGGNPATIMPSPTGLGEPTRHHRVHDHERAFTGKITGLVFDRFADFDGFLLDTLDGEQHRFLNREAVMADLAGHAWRERLLITVRTPDNEPCRPSSITLHSPPAPFDS